MHDFDLFPSLTLYHIHFYFTPSMFLLFIFIIFFSISPLIISYKFEGKFLICFDNLANRSYGYDLDDKRFSSGSRRICTASVEKINGEWKNIRAGSAITDRNSSLTSCSPSLILFSCSTHDCNRQLNSLSLLLSLCQKVKSGIPLPTSPLYPHYERSIECFNSKLNKSEIIFNLDPRKAEVCMAEAFFQSDRWTFQAGPTTIWRSRLSSINACTSSFLRLICLYSQCNLDINSSSSLIHRCSHSQYPHNESSSLSCPDCSLSMDESLPLYQHILPPLIRNGSHWIWKEGRGKISPPSIEFSIEGGDGKTRKPSVQTRWNIERRLSTTPSNTGPLFIYRPGKEDSKRENESEDILSLKQVSSEDSMNGPLRAELMGRKKKGEISYKNHDRKTSVSAMIREVWSNSSNTTISSTSNGAKIEELMTTTPHFSQLKGAIVKTRISAVISSNNDNNLSIFDGEEGEKEDELRERRKDNRDRGKATMKENIDDETKKEDKIKMSVVGVERREKTQATSIHLSHQMEVDDKTTRKYTSYSSSIFPFGSDISPASHSDIMLNLKILRMGVIIGFISISIIIIIFTLIITMLGRRLNSTTSHDNLLSSELKPNESARY